MILGDCTVRKLNAAREICSRESQRCRTGHSSLPLTLTYPVDRDGARAVLSLVPAPSQVCLSLSFLSEKSEFREFQCFLPFFDF